MTVFAVLARPVEGSMEEPVPPGKPGKPGKTEAAGPGAAAAAGGGGGVVVFGLGLMVLVTSGGVDDALTISAAVL